MFYTAEFSAEGQLHRLDLGANVIQILDTTMAVCYHQPSIKKSARKITRTKLKRNATPVYGHSESSRNHGCSENLRHEGSAEKKKHPRGVIRTYGAPVCSELSGLIYGSGSHTVKYNPRKAPSSRATWHATCGADSR